jgi:hypothetical protein
VVGTREFVLTLPGRIENCLVVQPHGFEGLFVVEGVLDVEDPTHAHRERQRDPEEALEAAFG